MIQLATIILRCHQNHISRRSMIFTLQSKTPHGIINFGVREFRVSDREQLARLAPAYAFNAFIFRRPTVTRCGRINAALV